MYQKKLPLWREIQRKNFTRLEPLADFLALSAPLRARLLGTPSFPLNLPQRLAEKITKNTLNDPILRQFIPLQEETLSTPGFVPDPLQDSMFRQSNKLLKKYDGRALLLATSACAMHCRFCFRQNFPYETEDKGFEKELSHLEKDTTISEIILSGGDPLSLSDETLAQLFLSLERIPHLRRIRFHTRFPIGIPERIDPSFLAILASSSKQVLFVIHCNHPKELDMDVTSALKTIQRLGIPTLNQSVLLRGVNDEEQTLLTLSEALLNAGVVPYYLHQLDLVKGAAHFSVSDERAFSLVKFLRENLPGYGVPRLVREEPHQPSKTLLL
jgi:EF-P beta-lysylation protein EpmB